MKRRILRAIYATNRDFLKDLMVEELLADVPKALTDQSIEILGEKRVKFTKWLTYQAYWLHRRNVSDVASKDKTYGMLLQIKAMMHLIQGTRAIDDESIGSKPEAEGKTDIKSELESVEKFRKGVSPRK
jgi:hypothetical protein